MFLRTTTITGEPSRTAALVEFVSSTVQPLVDGLDASLGLACFVDEAAGRAVVVSSWATPEARAASAAAVAPLREEGSKIMVGPAHPEDLDLLANRLERPVRAGYWARQTRLRLDPDRLGELQRAVEHTALPALAGLAGFCTGVLVADRQRGTAVIATTWDSREALDAGRETGRELGDQVREACGGELVEAWEPRVAIAGMRQPSQHEGVVRRIYAALSADGDLADLDAVIAPHVVDHSLRPGVPAGLEGIRAMATELRTAFPDLALHLEEYLEQGEMASAVLRVTGTQSGPYLGQPPTGRRMDITAIDVGRFVDGRCVEHWGVEDGLEMLVQLGILDLPTAPRTIVLPSDPVSSQARS